MRILYNLGFLFSGYRLLLWTIIFFMLTATLARAEGARHTASWYAANPSVLARVIALCRDNPGDGWNNPDCMNARQAQVLVAERQARGRLGDLTSPETPRYWADRPAERAQKLAICARLNPSEQARFFCAPARAAEIAAR